jgi:hypothetical protein
MLSRSGSVQSTNNDDLTITFLSIGSHLMLLDWFHSSQTLQVPLIEDILYSDNPQVINWFCHRNMLSVEYLCTMLELAFGCGKLQNASYLISVLNLSCGTEHLLLLAAESDSVEAVQLLQSLPKPPLPFYTYVLPALENGHLSLRMREFLLSLCVSSPDYQAFQDEVLCVQSIYALNEVFSRCGRIPFRTVSFAIQYNKPEILSWCIQHKAVTTSMLYNDSLATLLDRLPPEIKKEDLLKMLAVFSLIQRGSVSRRDVKDGSTDFLSRSRLGLEISPIDTNYSPDRFIDLFNIVFHCGDSSLFNRRDEASSTQRDFWASQLDSKGRWHISEIFWCFL